MRMRNEEAIKALKTIASYEDTLDYIKEHSVTVQDACNLAVKSLGAWEKVKAEINECLNAIDDIKLMGFLIELPQATERREMTYKQCLEFIDKHLGEVE